MVTDWNQKASEIMLTDMGGPWGQGPMVLIQAAVFEAANAITRRHPQAGYLKREAPAGVSIDAAAVAVNRAVLTRMATTQGAAIEAAYQAALATVTDGPAKADGIALSEKPAAGNLALRAPTGAPPVFYRPVAAPAPTSRRWCRPMPICRRPGAGCSTGSIRSAPGSWQI